MTGALLAVLLGAGPGLDLRGAVIDAQGNPAARATVALITINRAIDHPSAVDWENPQREPQARLTSTGEGGEFVFADVPDGAYWLWAGDGRGQAQIRRIGHGDESPPLEPLRLSHTVLEGEVLWDDGGTPAAGVDVIVYYDEFTARTNDAGRFRVPGIPANKYIVVVKAPLPIDEDQGPGVEAFLEAATRSFDVPIACLMQEVRLDTEVTVEAEQTLRLRLVLPGSVIEGVVQTPDGEPVVGASVFGGGRKSSTDKDGRFTLTHVPAGPCVIMIGGPDRAIGRVTAEPGSREQPGRAEITLYPFRPVVVFSFTDERGVPVARRTIFMTRATSWSGELGGLETDGEGRWRHEVMYTGAERYLFRVPGLGWAEQAVVTEAGVPETHCHVRLVPGVTVTGTVREQGSGDPVGGVALYPYRQEPDGEPGPFNVWNMLYMGRHNRLVSGYPVAQVSRDGDGTFRLSLPPGEYVVASRHLSITGTEAIEDFDVEVPAAAEKRWITGRALAAGGAPLGGIELTVIVDVMGPSADMFGPQGGVPRRVVTDEHGLFRLGPFDRREYWLTAAFRGQRNPTTMVDVTADTVDAGDFLLSATGSTRSADR